VPAAAAAALAGLRLARGEVGRRRRQTLWWRVEGVRRVLERHGEGGAGSGSAIQPMVLGAESRALEVSGALRAQGVLVPAIRYPTVARGSARLRVTATALHAEGDVDTFGRALEVAMAEAGKGGTA
jgi:7-keto-8-aminopelargonate synthetase-like enzyme